MAGPIESKVSFYNPARKLSRTQNLTKRMSRLKNSHEKRVTCGYCTLGEVDSMEELAKEGTALDFTFLRENELTSGELHQNGKYCYHLCCAILSPDPCYIKGKLNGVPKDIERAKKKMCVECHKPGATLACGCGTCYQGPGEQLYVHLLCGLQQGGNFRGNIEKFYYMCPDEAKNRKRKQGSKVAKEKKPLEICHQDNDSKGAQVLVVGCHACKNRHLHRKHDQNCPRSLKRSHKNEQNQKKPDQLHEEDKPDHERPSKKRPRPGEGQDRDQQRPSKKPQTQLEEEEKRHEKKQDVGDREKINAQRASTEYFYNNVVPEHVTLTDGFQDSGRKILPLPVSVLAETKPRQQREILVTPPTPPPRPPPPPPPRPPPPSPRPPSSSSSSPSSSSSSPSSSSSSSSPSSSSSSPSPPSSSSSSSPSTSSSSSPPPPPPSLCLRQLKFLAMFASEKLGGRIDDKYLEEAVSEVSKRPTPVLLGDYLEAGAGECRHRAILFKYLFDNLKLQFWNQDDDIGCKLVRGMLKRVSHAWNVVRLEKKYYLVDTMTGKVLEEGKDREEIDKYGRGSKISRHDAI
eukprot:g43476.t1